MYRPLVHLRRERKTTEALWSYLCMNGSQYQRAHLYTCLTMVHSLRICYKAQKALIIIHPHSRKPCIAGLAFKQNSKELKHQRRRRLRKRHLKSEFALPQTLSHLFQLVQFVKCWQIFLELNSKTASKFRKRKRKSLSCYHVLDKAWNLALSRSPAATAKKCTKKRDARAKLLFYQSKLIAFLPFSLPSPSSLLKLPKYFIRRKLTFCNCLTSVWLAAGGS